MALRTGTGKLLCWIELCRYGTWQFFVLFSYMEKHQIQLFGRGHIGGIDIKVTMIAFSYYFETNT